MAGDLDTAAAALDGVDTDGGPEDAEILLTRGKYAYFTSDFELARHRERRGAVAGARRRAQLAGARPGRAARHARSQVGSWFDRMRLELRRTRENPEIANAIFDGYLCPAEYMLYGQASYGEVISLARDLQVDGAAQRRAACRGVRVGIDRRGGAAVW